MVAINPVGSARQVQKVKMIDDECVVVATEALVGMVDTFERVAGRRPSVQELCELLTAGVQSCSRDLVSDAHNREITLMGSVRQMKASKRKIRAGDLVEVPAGGGSSYAALYLGAFGSFGHAFGVFRGTFSAGLGAEGWETLSVLPFALFVDEEYVLTGRWGIVSNRPDLLARFRKVELYHDPAHDPGDGSYGKFGLAESPEGDIRKLSELEARAIFVAPAQPYRQAYLGDDFERYLQAVAGP